MIALGEPFNAAKIFSMRNHTGEAQALQSCSEEVTKETSSSLNSKTLEEFNHNWQQDMDKGIIQEVVNRFVTKVFSSSIQQITHKISSSTHSNVPFSCEFLLPFCSEFEQAFDVSMFLQSKVFSDLKKLNAMLPKEIRGENQVFLWLDAESRSHVIEKIECIMNEALQHLQKQFGQLLKEKGNEGVHIDVRRSSKKIATLIIEGDADNELFTVFFRGLCKNIAEFLSEPRLTQGTATL